MFQQTIQDVLSLAEAGPRPEDLLESLRALIAAFEAFECGELVARTEKGLIHFVLAPGLGDAGPRALHALGTEPVLRVDTAADLRDRGLATPRLSSLLVLRIEAPRVQAAAIVLGHGRAWSFAAAPQARIRTLGGLALRLLIRNSPLAAPGPETVRLAAEGARLKAQGKALEGRDRRFARRTRG
ncbi:MAG: hypothetical protein ABI565_03755 [Vicinamibacteria bacterium]